MFLLLTVKDDALKQDCRGRGHLSHFELEINVVRGQLIAIDRGNDK